jgi:hypothetical protein
VTVSSGPITKVERSMPMYFRPYIDFSTHAVRLANLVLLVAQ